MGDSENAATTLSENEEVSENEEDSARESEMASEDKGEVTPTVGSDNETAKTGEVAADSTAKLALSESVANEALSYSEFDEGGFSEYELTEAEYFNETESAVEVPPEKFEISKPAAAEVDVPASRGKPSIMHIPASQPSSFDRRSSRPEEARRKISIDEQDKDFAKIPVPAMKPNKIIPKLPEPKYPLWPVKLFETEKIEKLMQTSLPRFFPRNYPYTTKGVIRRMNLLSQYLQRKVFQMGHDRRKLITVVRYHQKNWDGHKAVVRWLWLVEADALVKHVHHGEGFVVSAVVIGLYID